MISSRQGHRGSSLESCLDPTLPAVTSCWRLCCLATVVSSVCQAEEDSTLDARMMRDAHFGICAMPTLVLRDAHFGICAKVVRMNFSGMACER